MESVSTTIDLIRHGEPVGGRRYRGQIDDPLSEKGWTQMCEAVGEHKPWQMLYSSTLSRCADFAHELSERHGLPLELDPRLMEIGFGEWEGRTAAELLEQDPDTLSRFWSDPVNHRPAGAEALTDFRDRVVGAWEEIIAREAGKHLLIVGHAGMMRMIISHVLMMPIEHMFRIQVPNAGITRIQVDGLGESALPRLIFHAGQL
ncbi:MAG: alpha-ribazole phosphatase [Gammaproteobacteria bacterium]|nr:alpha-ribazole phosphatase [Gammaproteobacteria bacterium]